MDGNLSTAMGILDSMEQECSCREFLLLNKDEVILQFNYVQESPIEY